jgi:hypothetical protein
MINFNCEILEMTLNNLRLFKFLKIRELTWLFDFELFFWVQNTELKVWGPKPVYTPDKIFGQLGRQRYYDGRREPVRHTLFYGFQLFE